MVVFDSKDKGTKQVNRSCILSTYYHNQCSDFQALAPKSLANVVIV